MAYKGKGHNPLCEIQTSYCRYTLTCTSVLANSLEFVILERMVPILQYFSLPQATQTAYQSMCKHQMQMQSLHHRRPSQSLYVREIRCVQHSRITCAWQPLQSRSECVWQGVHGRLSHCTSQLWPSLKTLWIKCGVLQYSVLSFIHFILVVDPLLAELKGSRNICIASLDPICEH